MLHWLHSSSCCIWAKGNRSSWKNATWRHQRTQGWRRLRCGMHVQCGSLIMNASFFARYNVMEGRKKDVIAIHFYLFLTVSIIPRVLCACGMYEDGGGSNRSFPLFAWMPSYIHSLSVYFPFSHRILFMANKIRFYVCMSPHTAPRDIGRTNWSKIIHVSKSFRGK